jgi:protein TonB
MRSRFISLAAVVLVSGVASAQDLARTTMPVLIKEVKPEYTKSAMDRRIQGSVELAVVVQADGTVGDNVRVTKSLDPELDQQAIRAAKQWRFRPGTKDGEPVPVEVNLELTFTLRGGAPVYMAGNGVTAPKPIKQVQPEYTDAARQARVQGTVQLTGIVEPDGTIGSIRVTKALDPELDQQAIKALSKWLFDPGQKDGVKVRVQVNVEMTFTLK